MMPSEQPRPQTARESFEDFLVRFREVWVSFINHPALECPAHVRPDNTPCKTFVPWACVLGWRGYGERTKQRATLKAV